MHQAHFIKKKHSTELSEELSILSKKTTDTMKRPVIHDSRPTNRLQSFCLYFLNVVTCGLKIIHTKNYGQ